MPTPTTTQSVPYSAGNAFVTLIRKADGTAVEPPQAMAIESIQDINWDDKNTIKESYGQGKYAVRLAGGKSSLSMSLTVSEITGKLLNQLCYGQDIEQRQLKIYYDRNGFTVPEENSVDAKILQTIAVSLNRIDSSTSVEIKTNGSYSAAASSSLEVLPVGKYQFSNGSYRFSADDVGKLAKVTYVSNGTTLVSEFKIPKSLSFNVTQFTACTSVTKGQVTLLTKKPFGLTSAAPSVDEYRASTNGIIVFNSAQTGVMTVAHKTDGLSVSTVINTLPAAAYGVYLDPAASSIWTSNLNVKLKADAGTAMTGVAVGEVLTSVGTTPTTGEYKVDSKGYYLFAAADVGDTVTISYTTDYQFTRVVPMDDGVFMRDLGVRTLGGLALNRVALTSPLALEHDQYAVSDNGTYYFDETNSGETLFISYQYEVDGMGQTIVVEDEQMGSAPTLMLDLLYELDGEMMVASFERVKPMGTGISSKTEDFAGMKFEFKAFVNRANKRVYTLSTSV